MDVGQSEWRRTSAGKHLPVDLLHHFRIALRRLARTSQNIGVRMVRMSVLERRLGRILHLKLNCAPGSLDRISWGPIRSRGVRFENSGKPIWNDAVMGSSSKVVPRRSALAAALHGGAPPLFASHAPESPYVPTREYVNKHDRQPTSGRRMWCLGRTLAKIYPVCLSAPAEGETLSCGGLRISVLTAQAAAIG